MDSIKNIAIGGIITLVIGGGAYTFSQVDVAKNFANDTGLTQEQAENFINAIPEEELASWKEIGASEINDGQALTEVFHEIDCDNYEYEWESATLSCAEGKRQLEKLAKDSTQLGQAYIKLSSDSASDDDISETIRLLDQQNYDYKFEIVGAILDWSTIDQMKKTNSYNKALLKTALESK